MKAAVEGNELVIRLPLFTPPEPSKTGKTLVVTSTRGNQKSEVMIDGKPVTIGLTAYISR